MKGTAFLLRVTESARVRVTVSRSGGFNAPVTLSLGGENSGLEAAPVTVSGDQGTLSVKVNGTAPRPDIHVGQYSNLPYFTTSSSRSAIQFF